ncbi:MAG TPA: PepSY domain-containing protein [Pseudolabrys sp.]
MSVTAAAALAAVQPRLAVARDRDDLRHEDVRRAVETGEIRSLADIIAAVRGKLPGEVAGVEIERKDGHWRYEFRVVDGQGRLFDVYIDARNGEIERIKEK